MRFAPLLLTSLLLAAGCSRQDPGSPAPATASTTADPDRIAAHVAFLADDRLEGREAGSRGHDEAARYVSEQFAQAGLDPAGDAGSWLQAVPLLRGELEREGSQFVLERDGGKVEFRFEEEYLPGIGFDVPEWDIAAPLVYVGHGVVAPAFGHDDFAGVDVRGKIAVVVGGAPARFEPDARALFSSNREKQIALAERGAVGVVYIADPERAKNSPWARGAANWRRAGMRLRDTQGAPVDTFPQLRGSVSISIDAAAKLFAGAPQTAEEVFRRLKAGEAKAFDLPGQARLSGRSTLAALGSVNVVGVLRGSDPALANEVVVYSAHLDHLGIGAEVDGDGIYNGALDNALGSALLMETARLAAQGPRPARSQVFVAVTAEEKGLLGSDHFARHPGVAGRLVANLNIDMPVILTAQSDAITVGMEHSSLEADVQAAAAELGIAITPDPFPEEVSFIRSDQFSFVRRGIPALSVKGGITSTVAGVDARQQLVDFRRQHYHQPSDGIGPGEVGSNIHYPTAARLATLNLRMGQRIGNAAKAPAWKQGNFFGERFAGATTRPALTYSREVPLWPEDSRVLQDGIEALADEKWPLTHPSLLLYSPQGVSKRSAVLVFAGGGYKGLAIGPKSTIGHNGADVCRWLTDAGMTCILVKYRVPNTGCNWNPETRRHDTPRVPMALQDAQRALSIIRHNAAEYHIDPDKIGVMGFSAGGNLAVLSSTAFNKRAYDSIDDIDQVSLRPDFAIPVYPGHMTMEHKNKTPKAIAAQELNTDIVISKDVPPTLLIHAKDDPVDPVHYSTVYARELKKAGINVELQLYETGGHAFGVRKQGKATDRWTEDALAWLQKIGML